MRLSPALLLGTLLLVSPAVGGASDAPRPASGDAAAAGVEAVLSGPDDAARAVADAERAFAKTMADRDLEAFAAFLHPDTVWFSGPGGSALHGREATRATARATFEQHRAKYHPIAQQVVSGLLSK